MSNTDQDSNSNQDMTERLRQLRLVPVVVIRDASRAVPLARALLDGGLPCAEITFRTPAAREALARIAAEVPEVLVGAGTVLTREQAAAAREAGARFVVSPGFGPSVVDYCLEHGLDVYPGVCTPTEIQMALEKGLDVLKFFPAEPLGGASFLKALAAPFPGVRFIPTGGINAEHLPAYLKLDAVVACGGSWMAPANWIDEGAFDRIRGEVERAVRTVRELSGGNGP